MSNIPKPEKEARLRCEAEELFQHDNEKLYQREAERLKSTAKSNPGPRSGSELIESSPVARAAWERYRSDGFSQDFPTLSEFLSHLSEMETQSFFATYGLDTRNPDRSILYPSKDVGVRWRQLRDLLETEGEFSTRYPRAWQVLFGNQTDFGWSLSSFGIRVLENDPQKEITPPLAPKPADSFPGLEGRPGDARSATHVGPTIIPEDLVFAWHQERFSPRREHLRGVLLAILGREEPGWLGPPHDYDLLEGRGVDVPLVRITDLRLAADLQPELLKRNLEPILQLLAGPITAERVVRWKASTLSEPTGLIENAFGDQETGIVAVSFAAAALLLFLDLRMPRVGTETPCRLARKIESLAEVVRNLMRELEEATNELESILTNNPANKPPVSVSDHYSLLILYRMGHDLRDIARRSGINAYISRENQGTKEWKTAVKKKIARGIEIEKEQYPRAAAIFAARDNPHVQTKAVAAYDAYLVGDHPFRHFPGDMIANQTRISVDTVRGLEAVTAYIQLGSCLKRGIKPLL